MGNVSSHVGDFVCCSLSIKNVLPQLYTSKLCPFFQINFKYDLLHLLWKGFGELGAGGTFSPPIGLEGLGFKEKRDPLSSSYRSVRHLFLVRSHRKMESRFSERKDLFKVAQRASETGFELGAFWFQSLCTLLPTMTRLREPWTFPGQLNLGQLPPPVSFSCSHLSLNHEE